MFSTIGKKVAAYKEANPDRDVISLGIGDVTQPLAPAVIEALHKAVDEMAVAETFHGYAPDLGYEFLRSAIRENDYKARGVDTLYMLTQTLWQEEQENLLRKLKAGAM